MNAVKIEIIITSLCFFNQNKILINGSITLNMKGISFQKKYDYRHSSVNVCYNTVFLQPTVVTRYK